MSRKTPSDFNSTREYCDYVANAVASYVSGMSREERSRFFNKSGGCWMKKEIRVGEDGRVDFFKLNFVPKAKALAASRDFVSCFSSDLETLTDANALAEELFGILENAEELSRLDAKEAAMADEVEEELRREGVI